jgi:hypothetical protein
MRRCVRQWGIYVNNKEYVFEVGWRIDLLAFVPKFERAAIHPFLLLFGIHQN